MTRGQATEISLGGLPVGAVQHYVGQRVAEAGGERKLGALVYARTEGHPLFMVQLTEYLAQRGELEVQAATQEVVREIPQQLRGLIKVQVARLTPEVQRVLEAGCVAGTEFTPASVAVTLEQSADEIETLCEHLTQCRHFIAEREARRWPDGTASGHYGFRHALYQEVLCQRLRAGRRVRWHQRRAERAAAAYGERSHEIAAELALHFERGQDTDRAVLYLQQAGENALHLYAHREALSHFQKSVALLRTFPPTPERARHELALQFLLIQALLVVKVHASTEVEWRWLGGQKSVPASQPPARRRTQDVTRRL